MPVTQDDVAALFALPPEGFVAARDRLASTLREAGDPEAAAEVKALRRPTLVAWAVNVAARARPKEVARLLDAGTRLDEAQRRALAGRGDAADLRSATDDRRDAVRALAEAAAEALAAAGKSSGAHRDAVSSTFEAASVDRELGARLRAGTVEREARPPAGLGGFEGLTELPGGAPAATRAKPDARRRPQEPAARRKALEADLRAAAAQAKAAGARADKAEAAAVRAAERARALRASADQAAETARAAETEARRLRDAAATERRRASKSAEAATNARTALDEIEP
jgi:hypothetical protein